MQDYGLHTSVDFFGWSKLQAVGRIHQEPVARENIACETVTAACEVVTAIGIGFGATLGGTRKSVFISNIVHPVRTRTRLHAPVPGPDLAPDTDSLAVVILSQSAHLRAVTQVVHLALLGTPVLEEVTPELRPSSLVMHSDYFNASGPPMWHNYVSARDPSFLVIRQL